MIGRRSVLRALAAASLPSLAPVSCGRASTRAEPGTPGKIRLVFKYQPLGEPRVFSELLRDFERAHPDIEVVSEALPNAADLAHQYFLTALEGGSSEFDLFVVDVVWVAEFARAGWVADLSPWFPPAELRSDYLPGVAGAVVLEDRTMAVPWYVDVGVLYRRTDCVPEAPATYGDLVSSAERLMKSTGLLGYVWQGRQYEGLVCNVYEAIWGHGGETLDRGRVLLDTEEARAALTY